VALIRRVLSHPSNLRLDPEVVLPIRTIGHRHCITPFLRESHWVYSSFIPGGDEVDDFRAMARDIVTYATHVILFWDGKTQWLRDPLEGDDGIKRPTKVIRV